MTRFPPRDLVLAWLALLVLLALTVALAYRPLGSANVALALAIALTKVLIVAVFFMDLKEGHPLIITFAAAGLFWLSILAWLSSTDFLIRAP